MGVAMLLAAPFLYLGVRLAWGLLVENPTYAKRYFEDLFPVERILASRRWHGPGAGAFDCSYAIAELPADAAPDPGVRHRHGPRAFHMGWGGDWQPTPAAPLGDTTRDTLGACAGYFTDDVNLRLARALAQPGSLYLRGPAGETVFIHAPGERIAARLRYGD